MSSTSQHVAPPREGKIQVLAIIAGTTAQQVVNDDTLPDNDNTSYYYTFVSDVDVSITFGPAALAMAIPDPAAVAGAVRTFNMTAGTEYHWWIDDSARTFRTTGAGAGLLRWFRS